MEFHKRNERNISGRPIAIELNKVTSSWSACQERATLDSVSACFKVNQICAVIGPVGCGKVIFQMKYLYYIMKIVDSFYSHHYCTQFWEKYQPPLASLR